MVRKDSDSDKPKAKILIVEDSRTQLIHLQSTLENAGYYVESSENGKQALEKLETFTPDVILSDIIMPEMDGYELCEKINKDRRWHKIPIILLTALTDPQDVIKGLNVGADNFIPKPYSDDFLLSRINQLLVNSQMRSGTVSEMGMEIFFAGNKHIITSERMQIIDLLLSTYENAVNKNNELIKANHELSVLKEDLEKKNAELEKVNEEKNQFIGIAAHDIRNPLGGIYNFADLLKEELQDKASETEMEFINIIQSSSELLLNMVTELLDISKIESGKLTLKKQVSDLISFVKTNITKNKFLAENKSINIKTEYPTSSLNVEFDRSRLEQVLNNLITNAIKYSKPDTEINVKIGIDNDSIVFSIKDQGVGIPKEEQDKLFKPFSKTSARATGGETSTGLGLFTCKKIIDAHGGKIWVDSIKNEGSTFCFSLPADINELKINSITEKLLKQDKAVSKINSDQDAIAGKKILLVDDIEMNYLFFNGALSKLPIELDWAEDAYKAIDMLGEKNYDLILMDVHMPGMNGLELTRRIRETDKEVIIIAQTAYAMHGMEEKCITAGCNAYTAIPVKPREVCAIVVENLK
ncbi:MAG: hypothetical protein C0595_12025 [Marinilabiliales bacterium]|mgnify:CR=1 FL=1|nr:MAG: hypothetical protein C0595_12025 [Marinilabiliales bacterium]